MAAKKNSRTKSRDQNNDNNNSDKAHIHSQKSAQGTKHKNK